MTLILAFFSKAWDFITGKAGEWIAIGGAILASVAIVRKSGADSVKMAEQKQTLKNVEVKNEVETSVNKLSDDDVLSQLREQGNLRD